MSFDPLFDSESDTDYIARKTRDVSNLAYSRAAACPTCGNWPDARYDARDGDFVVSCCDIEARDKTPRDAIDLWCDKTNTPKGNEDARQG